MDFNLRREPTRDEERLLLVVYEVQAEHGLWPVWQHVEGEMYRRYKLEAQPILASSPRSASHPNYGWMLLENTNVAWPNPGDRASLSVLGLMQLERGRQVVSDFVRVVSYLAERRQTSPTEPDRAIDVVVTREELQREMATRSSQGRDWWTPRSEELDEIARLMAREPGTWSCPIQWPATGGFEVTVTPTMSRYRNVRTADEYVDLMLSTLDPVKTVATQNYPHGLALPEAIDYFNAVWRARFDAPIIRVRRAEVAARLAYPCESQAQFDSQLSGICQLLDSMELPDGFGNRLSDLDSFLQQALPVERRERATEAIKTLRAVFTLRAWRQHDARSRTWREAASRLGVTMPTNDWDHAWAQVRAAAVDALSSLREELEL